jgi:hypothetical protein
LRVVGRADARDRLRLAATQHHQGQRPILEGVLQPGDPGQHSWGVELVALPTKRSPRFSRRATTPPRSNPGFSTVINASFTAGLGPLARSIDSTVLHSAEVDAAIADAESGLAAYLEVSSPFRARGRETIFSRPCSTLEADGDRISPDEIVDLAVLLLVKRKALLRRRLEQRSADPLSLLGRPYRRGPTTPIACFSGRPGSSSATSSASWLARAEKALFVVLARAWVYLTVDEFKGSATRRARRERFPTDARDSARRDHRPAHAEDAEAAGDGRMPERRRAIDRRFGCALITAL